MRNTNKKGFTIVELVIVVAVIAILAAVLIPTFSGIIRKANESKDIQLIRNLNVAVAAELNDSITMAEALEAAAEYGFDVNKIETKVVGNKILWDSVAKVFCYLNNGEVEYVSDVKNEGSNADLWIIDNDGNDTTDATYSSYVLNVEAGKTIKAGNTVDVTACPGVNVEYKNDAEATVSIYTDGGNLTINAPKANVYHHGSSDEVVVEAVAEASYHVFAKVTTLQIFKGRVIPEAKSEIKVLVVTGAKEDKVVVKVESSAKIENVVVDNTKGAEVVAAITEAVKSVVEEEKIQAVDPEIIENVVTGAALFDGGLGTKESPYLIATAEQLQNIGEKYDTYAYYKVADGVESIDCAGVSRVDLNGSFNGNGASLNNVDSVLFNKVGTGADSQAVVIENFTIKFVAGAGIARVCATPNLTFKNISALGYLIEDWNGAVFLRYGTCNFDGVGFDYTVNFENCASAAEIYCTANSYSAILVGHAYPGAGKATINVDAATESAINATTLYYTGAVKNKCGYKYNGAGTATINVAGVEAPVNKITGDNVVAIDNTKAPVKENGVWGIATEADATKIVINLTWQYTLYTENYGEKIAVESGVGGIIGDAIVIEVANGESVQAIDKFESVEIKTGADKWDYEIANGKLTIYMPKTNPYVDGNLSLTVEQYTSGSSIAKYTGRVLIASKTTSADFIIK